MIKKEIKKMSKLTKLNYKDIEKIYFEKLGINSIKEIDSKNLENLNIIEVFELKREISKELKKINGAVFNEYPFLPKIKFYYLDKLIEFQKEFLKTEVNEFVLSKELKMYPFIFEIDSFRFRKSFITDKFHAESKELERYLNLIALKFKSSGLSTIELKQIIKNDTEISYNDKCLIKDHDLRELEIYLNTNNEDLKSILFGIIEIIETDIINTRLIRNLQKILRNEQLAFKEIIIPKKQYKRKKYFIF